MPGQKFITKAHGMALTDARLPYGRKLPAFCHRRDAADCPVEQGTFYGLADQTQTVFMRVKEI